MLGLYPFAPSILSEPVFHSAFDLIDDDFGWPLTSRRYVLPRRRYVYRHSPFDIDTLIDDMAGLTPLEDEQSTTTTSGKTHRRTRSNSNSRSPKLSPRRSAAAETQAESEVKSDVEMAPVSVENKETEVKTAEPSTASTTTSSAPIASPGNTDTTSSSSSASPSSNTNVATTESSTAPATTAKPTSVSPFRLIKQLNGLNLTLTSSDTAYTITTPVPSSINKSDLQLSVDNNVLTLSAQINSTQKNASGKSESSSSVYINRSVKLNRDADTDAISAHFSDGNLTITVPRIPSEKKQTINIE